VIELEVRRACKEGEAEEDVVSALVSSTFSFTIDSGTFSSAIIRVVCLYEDTCAIFFHSITL
jgi:hypothetical protein